MGEGIAARSDFRWARWQLRQMSYYLPRPLPHGFSRPPPSLLETFPGHVWSVCLAHLMQQILWQCWKKFLQFVTPNYHNNQAVPLLLPLLLHLLIDSMPCWPRHVCFTIVATDASPDLSSPLFALGICIASLLPPYYDILYSIHPHQVATLFRSVLSEFYSKRVCLFTVHLRT